MPGQICKNHIASESDYKGADCEPIQAVSQIDGIGGPNDNKDGQCYVSQAEVRRYCFEKRQVQSRIESWIIIEGQGHEEGRQDLK